MHQGRSLGDPFAGIQARPVVRTAQVEQLAEKVADARVIAADLDDQYLEKLVERLLDDIEANSGALKSDAAGRWGAPAAQLGTLQGAAHTLDRIGSALFLNLPVYLPELRSSRRFTGLQRLASCLREVAALCTFIAYYCRTSSA